MSMIKLYNPSDESDVIPFEVDDENKFVTHVFEGYDTLEFEVGRDDEIYKAIVEEAKVSDGKNRYVVKSIDERSDFVTIKCDVDIDDFKRSIIYSFRKTNSTLSEVLEEVVPESWTISYEGTFTKRTTVEDTEGKPMLAVTPIEVMDKAATVYGCVYNFNVLERKLVVIDPKIYKPDGKFFTDELNVENMGFSGSTDGFATRVYGFGKVGEDGVPLTFEDINDGKPYVENVSHSNKIISIGFSDERYTTKDGLLERAKEMLEEVSAPVRSYEFDAKNLDGDVWLYRVVTLIDRRRKTRIDHQIVEWKEYSGKYRYKDKLTLSSKQKDIKSFVDSVKEETKEEVSKSEQSLQSRFEQAIKNATDKITGNSGGNFVWIFDSNGLPTELVNLVDSQDINKAKSVWRWNASGLGHSNNGYNGEMTLALLADGSINASVITTGVLTANLIRAGKISDVANKNYWDLETGEFELSSGTKLVGSNGKETSIGNVVEYESKIAEISAKADSIQVKVGETETKVESVKKDLNNMSIGGTNLLLDTDAAGVTRVVAEHSRTFTSMITAGDAIGVIEPLSESPCGTKNVVRIGIVNAGAGGVAGYRFYSATKENTLGVSFVTGEQYTLSCYARAVAGEPQINITIWGLTAWGWKAVNTEWAKFSLTFEATEKFNTTTSAWAVFRVKEDITGTVEFTGFKLEKGNKATDWSPSPDEAQYAIDNLQIGARNLQLGTQYWDDTCIRLPGKAVIDGEEIIIPTNTCTELEKIQVKNGEVYTIGCDVKSDVAYDGNSFLVQFFNEAGTRLSYEWATGSIGTDWSRVVKTLRVTRTESPLFLGIGLRANSGVEGVDCTLTYRHMMVERGNRATDWAPASADVESQITTTSQETAELVLSKSSIWGEVTEVTERVKGVEGILETAEKNGILDLTAENLSIKFTEKLNNADGIHITGKNFDFNKKGLTIANEGFSMQNLLDEEGMEVTRDGEGILSATKDGVNAIDLTARQYLIVGKNARFEDYGTGRTACFWIGG